VIPFLAVTIGIVSAYSSTSGVVLPAFFPTVPGLIELGRRRRALDGVDDERRPSLRRVDALDDRSALQRIGAGRRRC